MPLNKVTKEFTVMKKETDVLDRILSDAIKQAKFYLEKSGEFFPFGVILRNNSELPVF
jgi:hypothetical protein